MGTLRATQVAEYFLAQVDEQECGDTISNLKLQKLLYYAQGVHLAETGDPLFREEIEAWDHGPVVLSVYRKYRQHGDGAIPPPKIVDFSVFSKSQKDVLKEVYRVFGQFSAWKLRNMTHAEPPWKEAWARGRKSLISPASMKKYFKTQLV